MMRGLIILTFCSGSCEVPDPMRWLSSLRKGLSSPVLPSPEALAGAWSSERIAA